MLHKLEAVLTTVQQPQQLESLKDVVAFDSSDFHHQDHLQTQLSLLHTRSGSSLTNLQLIVTYLKSLNSVEKEDFPEVVKVIKLILVMPATNAISERKFSALHRLNIATYNMSSH